MRIHVIVITCLTYYRFVAIIQVWLNILSNHPRILHNQVSNNVRFGPTAHIHGPQPTNSCRLGMVWRRRRFYIHPPATQSRTSDGSLRKSIPVRRQRIIRFCCWVYRGHDAHFLIIVCVIVIVVLVNAEHFDIYCHKIYQKLHFFS